MNTPRPAALLFLRSLILAVAWGGAVASVQAAPVVSNLTAAQRAGTKLVDISYDLDAPGFGAVAVTLEASSDGGATWTVPVTSATGAVGGSVTPGTGRAIVWNAGVDWLGNYSTQMRFRVVAEDGFSYIPGGSFTMGRTSGDTDADAPPIMVTLSPFYIQQTETTKAQWDEVRTWGLNNGYTDLAAGGGKGSNDPVHSVSWWDVVKWCNARSEREGLTPVYTVSGSVMRTGKTEPAGNWSAHGYRLPTEAEWEKAARGGVSGKRFPWGTDTINHDNANYYASSSELSYDTSGYIVNSFHPSYNDGEFPYTSPVRSFAANGYGLSNMSGNVCEWCWDWYGSSYYATIDGTTDPRGPASGSNRVFRGGSWVNDAFFARCATRGNNGAPHLDFSLFGFRPARSVTLDAMVPIPGGSFTMGVTSGDTDSDAPSITVTVSPFYIQQTETTKAQWDEVMTWAVNNGYTDLAARPGNASNHPVHSVNWWDVVKWCNARSEKEGLTPVYTVSGAVMRTGTTAPTPNWSANGYRLPTEAEWEKAARGGVSGKRFPWGTDTISHAQANYQVYSPNGTTNFYSYDVEPRPPATGTNFYHPSYTAGGWPWPYYTSPVGSFGANGYGLYDMAGNVLEWCWDWYGGSYYTTSNGTTDPRGSASGLRRVLRGGGCISNAFSARCASRGNGTPDITNFDGRGFRPVRNSVDSSISQTASLTFDARDVTSVTTPTVTSITSTAATLGGNVTSDGGASITERGVVYSATTTNSDPLISGTGVTKVTASGATGVFTTPVTGLTQGTNYSYKAYANNSQGTTYTTVATFTTLSTNADLSSLTMSNGTLTPTFASCTTAYTASVPNATTSITVTPTRAQADATIEVRVNTGTYAAVTSGSPSAALSLNVGTNTVDVRVTAQDGTTQKTYTVTVTRMATQSITFANPGAQLANSTVNLSATGGGSGNPVTFTVEGPATLGEGNLLTFTGAGEVRVRASQAGNSDFDPAADVTHTFNVVLPQPDVAVGLALDSLVGLRSYGNSGQQINLVSRFARPVTGLAILANRTILSDRRAADRLAVQANPGNRFFSITYSDVDGNATAGIVSGFYRTPAIDGTDAIRWLTARISPNKALLSEKKGKRTVYLRKTFTTRVRASSTLYPPASDAGVIKVLHQ